MRPKAILETALYVDDLERAETFYGGVLGLELITRLAGRHAFFRCGDGVLLLFNAEATRIPFNDPAMPVPTHGSTGAGHVCFRASSDEIDEWKVHLGNNGFAIEADFLWPGSGARSIYFRDPSGNSLEFGEPKIWGLA
jgi:catechol 2,3-dioxygenase-like lactoylglutathione lyase family enzyme